MPFGTTGLCFGVIMGAITPIVGEKKAAFISGIVQASAGVGDALMSPWLEKISSTFGIRTAMNTLVGFATCGFNMSIIESHLFSQFFAGTGTLQL